MYTQKHRKGHKIKQVSLNMSQHPMVRSLYAYRQAYAYLSKACCLTTLSANRLLEPSSPFNQSRLAPPGYGHWWSLVDHRLRLNICTAEHCRPRSAPMGGDLAPSLGGGRKIFRMTLYRNKFPFLRRKFLMTFFSHRPSFVRLLPACLYQGC